MVLATDSQIQNAWQNLPQLLNSIPHEKRDEGIMRMCVAVACGLFDSAINYSWECSYHPHCVIKYVALVFILFHRLSTRTLMKIALWICEIVN